MRWNCFVSSVLFCNECNFFLSIFLDWMLFSWIFFSCCFVIILNVNFLFAYVCVVVFVFVIVVCVLIWFVSQSRQPLPRRHHFHGQLPPPWISFLVWGRFRRQLQQLQLLLQRLFALRLLEQLLIIVKRNDNGNDTKGINQ